MLSESYLDYMRSEEWAKKNMLRLKFDDYRCKNCGCKNNLEVHHKSYDNIYNEDIKTDLITLCHKCHSKTTRLNRRKRWVVTDVN